MPRLPAPDPDPSRIERCCSKHADWPTLARHVADGFPDLTAADIARELRIAKDAVDRFYDDLDALEIAELIARHRLMLTSGERRDCAKLDPQRHDGRGEHAA